MERFEVQYKFTGLKYTVYDVHYENKYTLFLIYDWNSLKWEWVFAENYRPV